MSSMASMASAMVRAGLVDVSKVETAVLEERQAQASYEKLSQDITGLIRKKKPLRDLQSLAARAGKNSTDSETFFAKAGAFIEIIPLNLASKANQNLVQKMLQEQLDGLEDKVRPLIVKSRKMEQKWGFERSGRGRK